MADDSEMVSMTVRGYIEDRFREVDKRYLEREGMRQEAVKIALDATDIRLANMNEWRATYGDLFARSMTRTEIEALNNALAARFQAEVNPLAERVDQIGRTNWPLFGTLATTMFAVVAAVWVIIGLKIEAVNGPNVVSSETTRLELAQLEQRLGAAERAITASAAADSVSRADRSQLDERMAQAEHQIEINGSTERSNSASYSAKLVEVESQFHAMSDAMNVAADHDQQWMSLLYEHAFPGQHLPQTFFRPQLYK
jgi:hypothetical protein